MQSQQSRAVEKEGEKSDSIDFRGLKDVGERGITLDDALDGNENWLPCRARRSFSKQVPFDLRFLRRRGGEPRRSQ